MKTKLTLMLAALLLTSCATQRGFPPEHQIVNFDQVKPVLYRGAQPNVNGLKFLAASGVKSVLNLRMPDDVFPAEMETCIELGLNYANEPMSGTAAPSIEQMNRILAHIEQLPKPVFIHCQFGCDRTGTVVASWRIRHGVSNEEALKEAVAYGLSPLLPHFHHFILTFK